MKRMTIAAMAMTLAGCQQAAAPADTAAIEEQIKKIEAEWNHAYAQRDAAALATMYADDAAIANPDSDLVSGKVAIGEALIDIGRYPKHPDVRSLVYFVHDPEGYITNPKGLIADIERDYGALRAKVIIVGPFS